MTPVEPRYETNLFGVLLASDADEWRVTGGARSPSGAAVGSRLLWRRAKEPRAVDRVSGGDAGTYVPADVAGLILALGGMADVVNGARTAGELNEVVSAICDYAAFIRDNVVTEARDASAGALPVARLDEAADAPAG